MADKNRKISKKKGVELCADLLFTGETTKEIVRKLTESYGISRSTIEKWMKAARPTVEQRQETAQIIMARENEAALVESAKKLNLTRERILEEYAKLAFFDVRKLFDETGGMKAIHTIDAESAAAISGIESFDEKVPGKETTIGSLRKIKLSEKRAALDSICRVLGYNSAEKKEIIKPPSSQLSDSQFQQLLKEARESKTSSGK